MKKTLLFLTLCVPFISSAQDLTLSFNAGMSSNSTRLQLNYPGGGTGYQKDKGISQTYDIRLRAKVFSILQVGAGINIMPITTSHDIELADEQGTIGRGKFTTHFANPMIAPYVSLGAAVKFKRHNIMGGVKVGQSYGKGSDEESTIVFDMKDRKIDAYMDYTTYGYNAGVYVDYVYQIKWVGFGVSLMPTFYSMHREIDNRFIDTKYTNISLPVSLSANFKL